MKMNLDDSSHNPVVSVPGLPAKYSKRTELVMMLWAVIFMSPLLIVWVLTEMLK